MQERVIEKQAIQRLGDGQHVSVHEQTSAGRKQRSVNTNHRITVNTNTLALTRRFSSVTARTKTAAIAGTYSSILA